MESPNAESHNTESLFTRLLLATECSDFDVGAQKMALALTQRCQLPLTVILPIISNPEFEAIAPQIAAKADAEAAQKLTQLRRQAHEAHVTLEVVVRRGEEPYREIVEEANAQACEMLIIRRRGKRGFLANLLIGEMVTKVVAHAPCHVLIVPNESTVWKQRILVALDSAEAPQDSGQTLRTASRIALQCGLPLHIVSVVAVESLRISLQARMDQWVMQAVAMGVVAQGEICVGKTYPQILLARETSHSDLIVLNGRSKHHATRPILGSIAQKVIALSDFPVLVLHT